MNFMVNLSFSGESYYPKLLSVPACRESRLEVGVDMDEG